MNTTTIEAELSALKEGETLVILRKDEGNGYWLGVGDSVSSNVWVLTEPELRKIVELATRHLSEV